MPSYKDINLLTPKASVAGTEKIPVSDTEYIDTEQIIAFGGSFVQSGPYDFSIIDENGNAIVVFSDGEVITKNFNSANHETTANKVQSVSSASTHQQYPTAKCLYDLVGDIETLLAAI